MKLSLITILATLIGQYALADIGVDWDESHHGVIYRESGEVRLVLCPGELPDLAKFREIAAVEYSRTVRQKTPTSRI